MLFSYRWLAEYVELPSGADGARTVADRLTAAGLAVEKLEEAGDDLLFDVDVTTNRPDAMCHLGLAREAAVLLGEPLRVPPADPARGGAPAGEAARVVIEDAAGCPRYAAMVIRGVTVGPSPAWLSERLESIGLRPINNVVDVTNFVLWETGQPLHAFDLAKIGAGPDGTPEIRVRSAREDETLVTLDGERRELTSGMLVIADAERPVALAGVMGGLDSEVTGATADVLLESAHFDPRAVRRAASGLGMHTDASHRFERGADPEAPLRAAERAAALIAEVAGGTVAPGAVDARGHGHPDWPPRGRLELGRLSAFAGVEIEAADVERWLGGLGFELEAEKGGRGGGAGGPAWRVTVPSWRFYDFDLRRPDGGVWEQDLYEEVLRMHGLDAVPAALPAIGGSDGPRTAGQIRRDHVRELLAGCGFAEAINFAFLAREDDAGLTALPALLGRDGGPLTLENPVSERYAVLRRSLLPNLVASAGFNRRRGAEAVRLFEIGHAFFAAATGGSGRSAGVATGLPVDEVETVGLVAAGAAGAPWDRPQEADLFALKGVVESLARALGTPLTARPAELPGLIPGSSAELRTPDGEVAGYLGRVAPDAVSEGPGEGLALYAAELIVDRLGGGAAAAAEAGRVELPSRYPTVAADLTLTHAATVPWAEIVSAVEELRAPELVGFGLKDRYAGEGVPEGAVNTTLHFLYGSPERSLTQDEVNAAQRELAARLNERFGWEGG